MNKKSIIIDTLDKFELLGFMRGLGVKGIHATNGTYTKDVATIAPTSVAGFKYIRAHRIVNPATDFFLVAVNTDWSMTTHHPRVKYDENQNIRARKVWEVVARNFDLPVIGCYYDEETPKELYEFLTSPLLRGFTLHKWGGYGAKNDNPVIEGAENFASTFAFPYYDNTERPACWGNTRTGPMASNTRVIDLYQTKGPHRAPYLTPDNKPLFKMK